MLAESGTGDADGLDRYSQSVSGVATSDGAPSFGVRISHSSGDMSAHSLKMVLRTGEGTYEYGGTGRMVATGGTAWGGLVYTFDGTYKLGTRPCKCEPMPESGAYRVQITFSPKQQRIVATNVTL